MNQRGPPRFQPSASQTASQSQQFFKSGGQHTQDISQNFSQSLLTQGPLSQGFLSQPGLSQNGLSQAEFSQVRGACTCQFVAGEALISKREE